MPTEDLAPPSKCLHCESKLVSPIVCTGCQTLYPTPQSADYFDLLGLPRRYAIDEERLASAFRAITRYIHPDRFADQPPEVCALATRLSADVNRAVAVLSDPVQRAAYMLELANGPSAAEMRNVPGNLLAEVMMLREEIDQARSAGDTPALARLRRDVEARRTAIVEQLPDRADSLGTADDEEKKAFRLLLNSIRYHENLLAELTADPLARNPEAQNG